MESFGVEVDSVSIFDDFFVKCELCKQQIEMLSQIYILLVEQWAAHTNASKVGLLCLLQEAIGLENALYW